MDEEQSQRRVSLDAIAAGLRRVLRTGIRPARLQGHHDLLALSCVLERVGGGTDERVHAFGLEMVLLDALAAMGSGPDGRAARLLFGAAPSTRGLPLMQRRAYASDALRVSLSTFRQNYEPDLVLDVAAEVLRQELGLPSVVERYAMIEEQDAAGIGPPGTP